VSWAVDERSVDESPPHRGLIKLECLSIGRPFHPSLIFVSEARILPDREKGTPLRSVLVLLANIRLEWKCHTL
jgi:hypothetical protein